MRFCWTAAANEEAEEELRSAADLVMPLEAVESGMLKMNYRKKKVKTMAGIIEKSGSVALLPLRCIEM